MKRVLSPALALLAAALVLGLATSARADDDDAVMLKNGGRVRGTVVSEDPRAGVKIKLANGAFRAIPAAEVERVVYAGQAPPAAAPPPPASPPPPPASPATAPPPLVPAPLGPPPAPLGPPQAPLEQGPQPLADPGASFHGRPRSDGGDAAFSARSGVHLGVGGEGGFVVFPSGPTAFGSFAGQLVLNIGVAPAVDLRATASIGVLQGPFTMIPITGSFGARFNLGSVYSMAVGFRAGTAILASASAGGGTVGVFGPELSAVGFRFGSRSEFSVELTHRVGLYDFSGYLLGTTEHAIGFQALFL